MIASPRHDRTILLAIAAAFCIAILVEPEGTLSEAHRLCDGQPVQVFDSMTACEANLVPACSCASPENPWAYVYWLVILPGLGIAAALLLRSKSLPSAFSLVGGLAIGGGVAVLFLAQRESFEAEALAVGIVFVATCIAITLVAFGLARLARYIVLSRKAATNTSLERTREG
jgi:hypothetical protein